MSLPQKEMEQIMGATLERLQQARKQLACLNVKAEDTAKDIETVSKLLRGQVHGNCTSGFFLIDIPEGKRKVNWPAVQDMNDILMQREYLVQEIERLEATLKDMGVNI